jgi:hypothetical protein
MQRELLREDGSQLTIAAGSGAAVATDILTGIMVLKHMFTTALDKTI